MNVNQELVAAAAPKPSARPRVYAHIRARVRAVAAKRAASNATKATRGSAATTIRGPAVPTVLALVLSFLATPISVALAFSLAAVIVPAIFGAPFDESAPSAKPTSRKRTHDETRKYEVAMGMRECAGEGCGLIPLDQFPRLSRGSFRSYCNPCSAKKKAENLTTVNGFFASMAQTCAQNAKNRSGPASICTMTCDDFVALWGRQQGKCELTGVPMQTAPASHFKASPERLENTIGYVSGNVVLIIAELNTARQWTREKLDLWRAWVEPTHDQLLQQIQHVVALATAPLITAKRERIWRETIDGEAYIGCNECKTIKFADEFQGKGDHGCFDCQAASFAKAKNKRTEQTQSGLKILRQRNKIWRGTIDGIAYVACNGCEVIKSADEFCGNGSAGCYECDEVRKKAIKATLYGFMVRLVHTARKSTKTRVEDKGGEPCTIDEGYLMKLFVDQCGLCYWSSIPLRLGRGLDVPWLCSLERLDVRRGYVPGNVALVVAEMNPSDKTNVVVHSNGGSTSWNREKIAIVLRCLEEKRAAERAELS
jgi:hypothetical protein